MQEKYKGYTKKELEKLWKQEFKKAPFPYLSRVFLIKHLNYQEQIKQFGDLSQKTRKQLEKLTYKYSETKSVSRNDIKASKTFSIQAGTKLIREFKGIKYEVTALEDGFEFEGKIYKSLSAIANKITGTRWNGKLFFGVKNG